MKVFLDGKLVDSEQATVSVFDHGLLYGDGVFEGLRAYNGRIFRCQQHLDRLFDSAKHIQLKIPFSAEQLTGAMYETMLANSIQDGYLRLVVTRGSGYLGLSPSKTSRPLVFVIADQVELYPRDLYEKGMAVITSSVMRMHPASLSPQIKSLNYLNNILAKIEANNAGVPEAVMLNHLGYVSEATGDNIFVVKAGRLLTPPIYAGVLPGITRSTVMDLAKECDIPTAELNMTRHDLYVAGECFLTGTAAEVIAVTKIDNRTIGSGQPGPLTRRLHNEFHRLVRSPLPSRHPHPVGGAAGKSVEC